MCQEPMRFLKNLVSTTFLFAAVFTPAMANDRPPIKTIGIVTDVGDNVSLQHIGFMVFSNNRTVQNVPDWAIDAHIAAALQNGLKDRYDLHAVDFPRGGIAPELGGFLRTVTPVDNMRSKAKPVDGQPIDAYIVVWPTRREVHPTNQQVEGIGLLTKGSMANLYISLRVSLLDGSSGEEIEGCTAQIGDRSFWNPSESYMTPTPSLEDVESFDAMTPEQKTIMQTGLKQMLTNGMAYCLRDLKLVE